MATGSSGRTTVRNRLHWKRWVVAALLGLLFGLGGIQFLRHVHNPFADGVSDPLALLPADADFILSVPDLPRFVHEAEQRPCVARLLAADGFQEFLRTPEVRATGIPDALRGAFHELDAMSSQMPFGLKLLPDVSGTHVVLAGWNPVQPGDPFRLLLAFKPDSWLALAGVNVLLSPTLTDWFLAAELQRAGLTLERRRDSVTLTPAGGRPFCITRIADTVLVSTEDDVLSRLTNTVALEGVPGRVADRYLDLLEGTGADLSILARVQSADRQLTISSTLLRLWGPQTYALVRDLLPQPSGEDVCISVTLGETMQLAVRGAATRSALLSVFEELTADEVRSLREDLGAVLPADVFALVGIRCSPGRLVRNLLSRAELLSADERRELEAWCARTPAFGSVDGLGRFLDEVFDERCALAFFCQDRPLIPDKATAGVALVLPLRARARLLEFVEQTERQQTGAESLMRSLRREERDGLLSFEPELREGVRDDPRVSRPALAMTMEHAFLTNWAPFFEGVRRALREPASAVASSVPLREAGAAAGEHDAACALMDGAQLWSFLEQSVPGWAFQQTMVGDMRYREWRAEFHRDNIGRGIMPGTEEWKRREDDFVARREAQMLNVERPQVERSMRAYIERFRGLISSLGLFVEAGGSSGSLRLQLDVR